MHMLMHVLMRLGGRQTKVLHQQLERFQFVRPAGRHPRLFREDVQIGMGNRLEVTEDVFNPHFDRFKLLCLLSCNRSLHYNIPEQARALLRRRLRTVARPDRRLGRVEIDEILRHEATLLGCYVMYATVSPISP